MGYIAVGEILKAQGIKGEIKIKPITDDILRYKKLKLVYIDSKPYQIGNVRFDSNFAYLSLIGIDDRNKAELLRGKMLEIDRVNAVIPEEGAFFISDIVGCKIVIEDGTFLASVEDVLQCGAADVFMCKNAEGKTLSFPFLNRIIKNADIENKTITVFKMLLDEVCVYDD